MFSSHKLTNLFRGLILVSIFLPYNMIGLQVPELIQGVNKEDRVPPERLMRLEKIEKQYLEKNLGKTNSHESNNDQNSHNPQSFDEKIPDKTLSHNTTIKKLSTIAEEAGIPFSSFDTNKLLKITDNKLKVVIGFHTYFAAGYPDYKPYLLDCDSKLVREITEINAIVVEVQISTLKSFLELWRKLPFVRYVELAQVTSVSALPNDPDWESQYGPQIIQTDLAWDIQLGDPNSILVAVIDTGVDYNHPDLVNQYISGGYDYVNDDTDPMDDHSHGTHCAGIIAATINNSIGIAGVANVSIIAYKVFDSGGYGSDYDAASAIINATNIGADVLSNSYGFPSSNPVLADAIAYAATNDVVVVVSAGNSGAPVSSYPALYPEVITVSATDASDIPASFTSYGDAINVAAPGVDIWSTVPVSMGSYDSKSGTSMAGPHVAGICALIRAEFPSFTAVQVKQHLQNSADDLGPVGWDEYYGYGRVNAYKAVQPPPEHELVTYLFGAPEANLPDKTINLTAIVFNYGQKNETNVLLQLWINESLVQQEVFSSLEVGENGAISYLWTPNVVAKYNLTVYAFPITNETFISNNKILKWVKVCFPIISYNIGDFIELELTDGSPFVNFTYIYEVDDNHIRINFGDGFNWIIVNTLTRIITEGTLWVGYYYMGQIEIDISIGDTIKWFTVTGTVNNTVYYNWDGMLLEAWNITITEDIYAYYHKTTGIWLYYSESGVGIQMINTSFIIWQPPEHDLQASLFHPGITPVNIETLLNVSIYNGGVSNETNIEVQLWINESMVTSQIFPTILSGNYAILLFNWTPVLNGSYNITAFVVPVINETLIENNIDFVDILVKAPGKFLVFQDAYPWNIAWMTLLDLYGITYDIISSKSFGLTNLSLYERVIIPSDQPQNYYTRINNFLLWFESYVQQGGVLEIHATDQGENDGSWIGPLPNEISYTSTNLNIVELEDPSNIIFFDPYVITSTDVNGWSPSVGGFLTNYGESKIFLSSTKQPVMIEQAFGQGYFLVTTQTLELGYFQGESRFFENLLNYNPISPVHELGIALDTVTLLPKGTTTSINMSLVNHGLTSESNVKLQLWINNTLVLNNTYPILLGGIRETIQYNWNPSEIGKYNISGYVTPVPNEFTTLNNYVETICIVKHIVNYTIYELELNWFDAYLNGYNINMSGDDTYHALTVPFPFFYYDVNYTTIYISSNGWCSFVDTTPNDYSNPNFPTTSYPYSIAVFWDDLRAENNVYVWNTSSFLVIEYHNYSTFGRTYIGDFELILFSNGTIMMQYKGIQPVIGVTIGLNYGKDLRYYSQHKKSMSGINDLCLFFSSKPLIRHDISTEIEVPTAILYNETMSLTINTTVRNIGSYNETMIELQLYINNSLVLEEQISNLLVDGTVTFTYEWNPTLRGEYNITAFLFPVINETYTKNNKDMHCVLIDDPCLNFTIGDYLNMNYVVDGSHNPWALFIYKFMIDSTHVYVEISVLGGLVTGWLSVNIITRLIEDGTIWLGMYYNSQIETDLSPGDLVKWLDANGTIEGTVWYSWNGANLEAWKINLNEQYPGNYAYYDKKTGVFLYLFDPVNNMQIYITDTSIIELYAPLISILFPKSDNIINGTIIITWSAFDLDNGTLTYTVNYWNNSDWVRLITGYLTNSLEWNTSTVIDGDFYRIQIIVSDGYFNNDAMTVTTFIINNHPEPPSVQLLYPTGGENLSGLATISWLANDPDHDHLTFTLYYWYSDQWILIIENVIDNTYLWDTTILLDRDDYLIKVIANDGSLTSEDQSDFNFIIDNPHAPTVELINPQDEVIYNGTISITWDAYDLDGDDLTFTIFYWNGTLWTLIIDNLTETSYLWDTAGLADGNSYKIRIIVNDGVLLSEIQSVTYFIIDNPHLPIVQLISPVTQGPFTSFLEIKWQASDTDNDSLIVTLYYWDGNSWVIIVSELATEFYLWDISNLPNGTYYKIRIIVSDGILTSEDISETPFEIYNEPNTSALSTSTTSSTSTTRAYSSTPTRTTLSTSKRSFGFERILVLSIILSLGLSRLLKRKIY